MCWVYLLLCSDGSYYVGSTTDLQARLGQHQEGLGANHTRTRRPVVLLWSAEFSGKQQAHDFERRVHGWRRSKKEALIEGRWEDLPELSSRSWAALRARAVGPRLPVVKDCRVAPEVPIEPPRSPAPRVVDDNDPWRPRDFT